jgi:hypothetical protein
MGPRAGRNDARSSAPNPRQILSLLLRPTAIERVIGEPS